MLRLRLICDSHVRAPRRRSSPLTYTKLIPTKEQQAYDALPPPPAVVTWIQNAIDAMKFSPLCLGRDRRPGHAQGPCLGRDRRPRHAQGPFPGQDPEDMPDDLLYGAYLADVPTTPWAWSP